MNLNGTSYNRSQILRTRVFLAGPKLGCQVPGDHRINPLVSVVVPTRGRPNLLGRALDSVFGQTYKDIETVVVVDGEDRDTRSILKAYQRNNPGIVIVSIPVSLGGSEARNIGIRKSTGKYIALLDDDDEWLPLKLERQIEFIIKENLEHFVVSCKYIERAVDRQFVLPRVSPTPHQRIDEYFFCREGLGVSGSLQTSTLLFPRELALRIPFDRGLERGQDLAWMMKSAHDGGARFHLVPEILSYYNNGSFTDRAQMSKRPNWRSLFDWVNLNKQYFTSKSYAYCLHQNVLNDAIRSKAKLLDRMRIISYGSIYGRPDFKCIALMLYRLLVPAGLRARFSSWLRLLEQRNDGTQTFSRSRSSM